MTTNYLPKISIITPTLNQGRFIEDTILSIKNQDYENIEHIIVDGGSTDNTLDILRSYHNSYNMSWVSEPDGGQSDAINKGIHLTTGDIVAWLNSDDIYIAKDTIRNIAISFRKDKSIDVLFGDDMLIDENNQFLNVRAFSKFRKSTMMSRNIISQPTTFLKREVFVNNCTDVKLKYVMDYELWLRLSELGYKLWYGNRLIAGNRIHSGRKMVTGQALAMDEFNDVRMKYGYRGNLHSSVLTKIQNKLASYRSRLNGLKSVLDIISGKYDFAVEIKLPAFDRLVYEQMSMEAYKRIVM